MPAGRPTIEFDNGDWCYTDGDYAKHGQHYLGYGSCNYVNFHLYNKELINQYIINLSKRPLSDLKRRK